MARASSDSRGLAIIPSGSPIVRFNFPEEGDYGNYAFTR
jgi:hypothetical protein